MNASNAQDYLPLVQALAEGKTIQVIDILDGGWIDIHSMDLGAPANHYRVKPEPREIWVNRHEDAGLSCNFYASREAAADGIRPGWEPVCFREVIE